MDSLLDPLRLARQLVSRQIPSARDALELGHAFGLFSVHISLSTATSRATQLLCRSSHNVKGSDIPQKCKDTRHAPNSENFGLDNLPLLGRVFFRSYIISFLRAGTYVAVGFRSPSRWSRSRRAAAMHLLCSGSASGVIAIGVSSSSSSSSSLVQQLRIAMSMSVTIARQLIDLPTGFSRSHGAMWQGWLTLFTDKGHRPRKDVHKVGQPVRVRCTVKLPDATWSA